VGKNDKVSTVLRIWTWRIVLTGQDGDDEANAMDGEDDEDGDADGDDGDDNENEEDEDEEVEGEGEGEAEGSSDKPADTNPVSTPAVAESEVPTQPPSDDHITPPTTVIPAQEPATSTTTPPTTDVTPAVASAPALVPETTTSTDEAETSPTTLSTTTALEETHPHTAIPSNAIELSNTAPNHTEDGGLNHPTDQAGIEITQPEKSPAPLLESGAASTTVSVPAGQVGSLGQNEDKMDIDEPNVEKGETVEEDAGLVMGEMTPPVGEKGLENTEMDQVKETEAAVQPGTEADTTMGAGTSGAQ